MNIDVFLSLLVYSKKNYRGVVMTTTDKQEHQQHLDPIGNNPDKWFIFYFYFFIYFVQHNVGFLQEFVG